MLLTMKTIEYFGGDIKRINHVLKVVGFAKTIADGEMLSAHLCLVVEYAALFHDIGIKNAELKYHSSAGKYQELEGPPVAREILLQAGIDEETVERVCFLVGNHHSYTKIDGADFRILVEADFLVNIDEEDLEPGQIQAIKEKYFVTETGRKLVESMYNV